MSQSTVPKTGSNKEKEIEENLETINFKPGFLRIEKPEKDEYSKIDICPDCGQNLERPYWEPRYNGIKGRCSACNVIWKLS